MNFIFPYTGNVIIPTDFHIFQRGWNHQPVSNWDEYNLVYELVTISQFSYIVTISIRRPSHESQFEKLGFISSAAQKTGYDPTNQGLTQQGYSMLLCWFTIFGGKDPQTVHQNWVHDRSKNGFVMGYTFWPYVAISLGKMMINQWI